jgi:hypothetical protein
MKTDICEECGGEVEFRRQGSIQGLFCTHCGWSVVTTFIPEIKLDRSIYTVRVRTADFHNAGHVRAVASVASLNFPAARRLLQEEAPVIYQGMAPEVVRVRAVLADAGLATEITPVFRY